MFDLTARGSDGSRFVPLANLGDAWTPEMRWLHILGDLSLWLAFVSIPVVVIYFQRYRRGAQGSRLPMLLVVFFLMCGFGYLLDAFMFQYPLYQLSAVWKAATGTVAWTCVIAIMAIAPRVLQSPPLLGKSQSPIAHSDSELHWLAAPPPSTQVNDYIIGILAAVLALLIRAVIQPIATTDQFYSLSLLAVVFVSWHSGFGPALVTLFASMLGMLYFFIEPRNSFGIKELSNQLATAVFFFCGVFCAALGEAQRRARRGTKEALAVALEQKDALAKEIIRRAEAEEAMRESEARFRSMADSVPALIWLSDVDRKRTYLNKTWQDFTGHKPEEDLGDKWVESIHPEDRDRYLNEYVAAFGGGRPFEVEYRLRRSDGAYRWVLARGTPLRSPSGSFAGFVGLCLDVTDRKRADEQLRRSEKELADFFENVNVGLHWVAQDGTILRANRAELEMVGLPKDEYEGRNIAEFHLDKHTGSDFLARLSRGERIENYPSQLKRRDGTTRDVLITSSVLWKDGRFVHSRCFTNDVTNLKRAEAKLHDSKERFRMMAQTVPSILWTAAADGAINWVNDRWLEYCGISSQQVVSALPDLTVHPEDRERRDRKWAAALASGDEYEIEMRHRRHDGEYRWFITRAVPVRDAGGEVRAWFGATTDIDDRKRTEDQLRASEERFRTLTEAIPQIVWNADAAGNATYFNRRWRDYTGMPIESARGWDWLAAVHPADRKRIADAWEETVQQVDGGIDDRFSHELRLHGSNEDEYRWFLSVAVPLRRPDGSIDQWIGSMADIHDQKAAAESIVASEKLYRAIGESINYGIWVCDPAGRTTYTSPSFLKLVGMTQEECSGFGWIDALHPDDVEETLAAWNECVRHVGEWNWEHRFRGADGEYHPILARGVAVTDEAGRVSAWVGINLDISDLRRAEETLRESEEKFRTLADNMSQFAWMTDETGWIFWYNQRWFEYTGTTLDEMRGWGWKAVHHPEHVDRVVEKISRCFATGEPWEDTFPLRGRDGNYRWFLSRALPIRDESGKIVRWFGTNTDITEQREMEQAVRDAADRFRTLAEAIPNIVWTATRGGEMDYFNPRWHEYTGSAFDATRGHGWLQVVHADDRDEAAARWQAAVGGTSGVHECELRLRRADGEYRWFLVRGLRVSPSVGPGRWVGTLTDIHDRKMEAQTLEQLVHQRTMDIAAVNERLVGEVEERKRAEMQALAVATELARSNSELEQFAYVASHDLQEPLRKIQAFGDRLKTKIRDDLPALGREYVDRMLSSAGRMQRLIEDLLSFSRVTTQARPFATIELGAIAADVVNDLSERIVDSGGEVRIGELPSIEADPTQMRQLFQNLIANALKFSRPGVPPLVEVSAEVEGCAVGTNGSVPVWRLTFRDNGIGFDEKYLGRIFQVFQRLHGRDEYEGTGVGLAICRKIVERHGGAITAQSRVGEGTTFVVSLPIRQPLPAESPPPAQYD